MVYCVDTDPLPQVVIENQNNALKYADIVVDKDSAVRQDMFFDKAGDHLYVMTSNKVCIFHCVCSCISEK